MITQVPSFILAVEKGKHDLLVLLEDIIRDIAPVQSNLPNDWQQSLSNEEKTKLFVNISAPARNTVTYRKNIMGFLIFVRNLWTHRARFGWPDDYMLCNYLQVVFPWFLPAWVEFMSRANQKAMHHFQSTRAYFEHMQKVYHLMAKEKQEGKDAMNECVGD
jgi:hypothetical protein